jgi:hypothetical protein
MFLTLGAACVSGSVLDAQTHDMSAKVPFAFQVSNKTLAAGKYQLGDYGATGVLYMKNASTGEGVFIGGATHTLDNVKPGRLVFHCYGAQACFLAEVWPVSGRGSVVPKAKAEKEIIKGEGPHEMATISINIRQAD